MLSTDKEVLIIGGGLFGLSLSILLKRKGYDVSVLEQGHYPRQKVCGEYLSTESLPFLLRLGLEIHENDFPHIHNLRFYHKEDIIHLPLDPGGIGISRLYLDHALYQQALSEGVDVQCGFRVKDLIETGEGWKVKTSGGETFLAKKVVGAYGKSRFGGIRAFKGENMVAVKYHVNVDIPENTMNFFSFRGGYAGLSRVENERSCFCYLVENKIFGKYRSIKEFEKSIIEENPGLKKLYKSFNRIEPAVSISNFSLSGRGFQELGMLKGGDAVQVIAPLCGNGMSMAFLMAEKMAAHFTLPEIKYKKSVKKELKVRLVSGKALDKMIKKPLLATFLCMLVKQLPGLGRRLASLTHGKPF